MQPSETRVMQLREVAIPGLIVGMLDYGPNFPVHEQQEYPDKVFPSLNMQPPLYCPVRRHAIRS